MKLKLDPLGALVVQDLIERELASISAHVKASDHAMSDQLVARRDALKDAHADLTNGLMAVAQPFARPACDESVPQLVKVVDYRTDHYAS